MKIFSVFCLLLFVVSCDSDWVPGIQAISKKADVDSFALLPHPDVSGNVYLMGPKVDSNSCKLWEDSCTCCRERVAFINDSEFVSISYCEKNESYCKGRYIFYGPQVILNFSKKRIDHILQKDLLYKSADKMTISERINQNTQWILVPFNCNEIQGLENETESLFGFRDSISGMAILEDIKNKGIFDKLSSE